MARPLVLGEDPGLLSRLTSAWSLLISVLWLLTAVGWASWRAWSGQTSWRGSGVEAGLLALAALMWVSAEGAAPYKHPARLIASEWLVLLCAYCLVRQLTRSAEEDRGLLAALLASAVSISAFSLYQYTVVLPALRQMYGGDPQALLDAMAAEGVVANPELLQRRLSEDNVFGTYSHPNSLAGYLALVLPLALAATFTAIGACAAGRRPPHTEGSPRPVRRCALPTPVLCGLAAASTLLVGLALWLTHSRGAILASLLVGAVVVTVYERRFLAAHKAAVWSALAMLAVCALLLYRTDWLARGTAKFWESAAKRFDYWSATWSMIRASPWLGVGPGNFGRLYPRYMLPRAFEQIKDPHNFILEIWATGGLFALLALVLTLVAFFGRIGLGRRGGEGECQSAEDQGRPIPALSLSTALSFAPSRPLGDAPALPRLPADRSRGRWEFYLGGLGGLVLGFVLRSTDQSADEVLLEGAYSACRALVWFAAFPLFFRIPCSGAAQSAALTAGAAALLLNLLFSGGIAMPSVAQPLWVAIALALNLLRPCAPDNTPSATRLMRVLPLPVLASIGLAYFGLLFLPALGCSTALAQARLHYVTVHALIRRAETGEPQAQLRLLAAAVQHLKAFVLTPLERAVEADPQNAAAWLELAEWYGELCKVCPMPQLIGNSRKAIACVEKSQLLDPDNKEPYLLKHTLHLLLAERCKAREKEEYGQAAEAMRAAVERDPTNARLRYQLAETLFLADLAIDGRRHATIAQQLDEQATRAERRLSPSQRQQIQNWLNPK